MKKFSFIFLIFISFLKVEGTSFIPLYSHEYSNKTNIECVYDPIQNNVNYYFNLKPSYKTNVKNHSSIKNFLFVNKLSLLYFNEQITQQLKLNRYLFAFHIKFLKIPGGNTSHLSSDEDYLD